jgi:hypothetical protein
MSTPTSHAQIFARLGITPADLAAFCQRWDIDEVSLFGSVLRNDFRPDSDIDVLISYAPGKCKGLLAQVRIKDELEKLARREVDVMTKQSIEQSRNELRRREILGTAQVIYVA